MIIEQELGENKMLIRFNPARRSIHNGAVSMVSWNNPDVHHILEQLFKTKPHEEIVSVDITEHGIRACFKY